MKAIIFLIGAGIALYSVACTRPGINNAEENMSEVVISPYAMPTPDSLAFAEGKGIKCGVNQFWYKYCGYTSAQNDLFDWLALPSFARLNKGMDSETGQLNLYTYGESGSPLTCLSFARFSLAPGIYFPVKNFLPTTDFDFTANYHHLDDGCAHYNWYGPDTTKVSFLQVLDYDPARKEIKARFRVHLKARKHTRAGYPDTLTFDDGIVFARSIN